MDFLLIGMSRFARRRVLPAAAAMSGIDSIDVASAYADAESVGQLAKLRRVHRDWRVALDTARPGLVYVSLVNSEHAAAVRHALKAGHHVVVDKPGLLDPDTAREMVSLARSSSLVLAEAVCYSFHPAYAQVTSIAERFGGITNAVAVFTPPVPRGDFRYDRSRGGGAFLDTGPYMASLGRVLWQAEPEQVNVLVSGRTEDGLETAYSVLAGYPGGRTAIGHFGFTTVYQNTLRLLGSGCAIDIERPFSLPPETQGSIRVHSGEAQHVHRVARADSMRLFLARVLEAVRTGSREWDAPLLSDARTLGRIIAAGSSADPAPRRFAVGS
ncbi:MULTISPECIES: Gfo/Idh/MocA family protein [unclassified Streptomyces]|uniref:Gfo/Idh/MocA family protein n=1 Tax=unclassified Streptomyces TaxID=2593676 RepID=UPI002DD98116|nr:Gfo/Idh/MocA family oxidoreductase [Streptomyces sp. NBC_01237]WRZ78078.1 Gfo/Idh/MocA family oxidoreductase [Streptomyces sp. NBC_01237]